MIETKTRSEGIETRILPPQMISQSSARRLKPRPDLRGLRQEEALILHALLFFIETKTRSEGIETSHCDSFIINLFLHIETKTRSEGIETPTSC